MTMLPPRILCAQIDWAQLEPRELTYPVCNICGTCAHETLASLVINWTEFFLVRCARCGLIWRTPLPGPTFSRTLYSEKYYRAQEYPPELRDQVGIADTEATAREFRDKISEQVVQSWIDFGIVPTDPAGSPRKYLEIGGGRGYLQQAAAARGWVTMGLELSVHGIREAIDRRSVVLPVVLDELCTRYMPYARYFDLVVFYDFLEHVEDPSRALRMVYSALRDDGVIIFRVPNTVSPPRLHLIDHIWHFDATTLPMLLHKEGFDVLRAHHSGTYRAANGDTIDNITVFGRKRGTAVEQVNALVLEPNPLGL